MTSTKQTMNIFGVRTGAAYIRVSLDLVGTEYFHADMIEPYSPSNPFFIRDAETCNNVDEYHRFRLDNDSAHHIAVHNISFKPDNFTATTTLSVLA